MRGTVKFYDPNRRFGFVAPDQGDEDVFVHASEVESAGLKDLFEGDRLQFDVLANPRRSRGGYVAANLKVI